MTSEFAPIAFFCYNRADKLQEVLSFLCKNQEAKNSTLYIFCDGPKDLEDRKHTERVHGIVDSVSGFKDVIVIKQEENKGLANSIIDGVNYVLERHESVIVLEDDILVSEYFLKFMNDALAVYEDEDCVASISAYSPNAEGIDESTYFLQEADCWGWATWRRAWAHFEESAEKLLSKIEKGGLQSEFNRLYPDDRLTKLLLAQRDGRVDSWAIRWIASTFLKKMYTLYPQKPLIENIGLDGNGTHNEKIEHEWLLMEGPVYLAKIKVEENEHIRKKIHNHFSGNRRGKKRAFWLQRIFRKLIARPWNKLFNKGPTKDIIYFYGDFKSWEEAKSKCTGYEKDVILEKTKSSMLKIKNGEARYERDSVLMEEPDFAYPLLVALLYVASLRGNKLNIIDFGGALGSTYYQTRPFLSHLNNLDWRVVEQPHYVEEGNKLFEDEENLTFFETTNDAQDNYSPDIVLFSSVLQYLPDPYTILREVLEHKPPYIFIDRTAFMVGGRKQKLTIQKIHEPIYEASYPAWFLNEKDFLSLLKSQYELIYEFDAIDRSNVKKTTYKGMFFKYCH